jgi:hypothetical protein
MFPVKYEIGFISQKTPFFIVTVVKNSNLICINHPNIRRSMLVCDLLFDFWYWLHLPVILHT